MPDDKTRSTRHLPVPAGLIQRRIYLIRGQKVMLDSDLAELYQVATKRLNEQVRRNLDRFPEDFMFQLNAEEAAELNRSQIATGSQKHRSPRYQPYAFTEHGVAMLSAVLKSDRAVKMSIFIVRAFIELRDLLANNKALAAKIEQLEATQNRHAGALRQHALTGRRRQGHSANQEPARHPCHWLCCPQLQKEVIPNPNAKGADVR